MEKVETRVKALIVPVLLSVIASLLTIFGTVSVDILKSMSRKIDRLVLQDAKQQKDIEALEKSDNRQEATLAEILRTFARKEEIFELTDTRKKR